MISPENVAGKWLAQFGNALRSGDAASVAQCFDEECFWRDHLTFTWNIITLEGRDQIAAMLDSQLAATAPRDWTLVSAEETDGLVEAWMTFETAVARGTAHVRLRGGLCWTLLTVMRELVGHEEPLGKARPPGVEHRARRDRVTWLDERSSELSELGFSRQPHCVIIGGGQGGIALAARLKMLGVPTIILETRERPGDSWRHRYRSLVLHDPVWYDHLPYIPFPENWPVFTPKDKMGDWLEAYAKIMELDYWGGSTCTGATYDSAEREWSVTVERSGGSLTLRPRALVFATGAYGFKKMIDFPGTAEFCGEILHTSEYQNGELYAGKRCAVIGSGSSAHDVCVDLWENGAEVTMIQRSPSIVVRSETLMEKGFGALYSQEAVESGMTTEKADLLFASMPFRLLPQFQKPLYEEIARVDAGFYERLGKAGFLYDFGEDGSGLLMKALRTASGYYIDVGCCELIANGEVKVASGAEIDSLDATGVKLSDGRHIDTDVIIQATGYGSMDEMVAHIISPQTARNIGPFWGYGSGLPGDPGPWEGELRNMWKPTAQEALWFHGGNLALSRHYSLYVALQIKARMEGISTPVYRAQARERAHEPQPSL